MKARSAAANSAGRAIRRPVVLIHSCPELDAYLSGNTKWKSKAAIGEKKRLAPWAKLAVKRMKHSLNCRLKQMAASISSRKRLRGDNKKQKIEDLIKQVAVRFFVWKDHLPDFLIRAVRERNDRDFLARAATAYAKGVKPLFDEIDITILACWDSLDALFSCSFFSILVTDEQGRIIAFNQKFVDMWQIPDETLASRAHQKLLEVTERQFLNSQEFRARITAIYTTSPAETFDVLETADGRVFERYSAIQRVEDRNIGRVWSFRDITQRKHAEAEREQLLVSERG